MIKTMFPIAMIVLQIASVSAQGELTIWANNGQNTGFPG